MFVFIVSGGAWRWRRNSGSLGEKMYILSLSFPFSNNMSILCMPNHLRERIADMLFSVKKIVFLKIVAQ